MEIYFEDVEDRLERIVNKFSPYELTTEWIKLGKPWLWVIHNDPEILLEQTMPFSEDNSEEESLDNTTAIAKECLRRGGCILFLSGQPVEKEKAENYEKKYDNRIHCLRVSCSSGGDNRKIENRLDRFLQKIKSFNGWDPIPWEYVEPEKWPENLIAIYLTLTTLEQLKNHAVASDKYDRVIYAWNEMPENWKKQIWENAWEEYNLLQKRRESEWKNAGFPLPGSHSYNFRIEDSSKGLELIKQVLLRKNA